MRLPVLHHRQSATALLLTLMIGLVLAAVAGTGFRLLQNRYRIVHQAASWQEALLSAEAGVDLALNQMRLSLADPDAAWTDWQTVEGASAAEVTVKFSSTVLFRTGEGGTQSFAKIQVDAPASLKDESNEQWYRIRSTGVSQVPGSTEVAGDKADLRLRKLDLTTDHRTQEPVSSPQVSRVIEAIVKPVGTFRLALMGVKSINLNNHNIRTDSFDSRYEDKSTNGRYVLAKAQANGNIATNASVLYAGNAQIHGTASVGGTFAEGSEVLKPTNVTGGVRDQFFQEILTVKAPNVTPVAGSPSQVNGTTTLMASADASAYILSSINLSGQNTLRIQGASDGVSKRYAVIVVTGNVSLSGQAAIILDPGVFVSIFVKGDTDITGQGVTNPWPNRAANFQYYGVDRPKLSNGSDAPPGTIKIAGNGSFTGAVYAPNFNVEMKGGGSDNTSIVGSFLGNTVFMNGVQQVHYDEALADGGLISDYKVVSWFEDAR